MNEHGRRGTRLKELYGSALKKLKRAGVESPELEARIFIKKALGATDAYIYAHPESSVNSGALAAFDSLIERRLAGEPVAYILEEKEFYSRSFSVNRHVLIPRPETELVVREALGIIRALHEGAGVVDVGTGCGCIAVTVALEAPGTKVVATDSSQDALEVAASNARRLCAEGRVEFLQGDLLSPLGDGTMDVVVSNSPYVSEVEYGDLSREVRDFEPPGALIGGKDGLDVIRRIVRDAPRALKSPGSCVIEIGESHGTAVKEIFAETGFIDIAVVKDYAGLDRVVRGQWRR